MCVVHIGGEEPAQFIARYANRIGYYHIKDGDTGVFTELGQGGWTYRAPFRLPAHQPRLAGVSRIAPSKADAAGLQSRQFLRSTLNLSAPRCAPPET